MLPVELICVPQEVAIKVAISIILIIILSTLIVEGGLHVNGELSIIHKKAGVCFNIILLIIISTVFRFFMKLIIYN